MTEIELKNNPEFAGLWDAICKYVDELAAARELLKEAEEVERQKKLAASALLGEASKGIGNLKALLAKSKQDNINMIKAVDEMKALTKEIGSDIGK